MSSEIQVEALNISIEKGTVKKPVNEVLVTNLGFENDAHAGAWHRQVSLLSAEDVEQFAQSANREMAWGEFAENITTRGLDLSQVAVLDRLVFGDVELEITQIGKACHHGCEIFQEVGACIMPKQGLFARVINGGKLHTGMSGTWIPRKTKILIITLSDRAYQGIYEDKSGPTIEQILEENFGPKRDHQEITRLIIPDDPDKLIETINAAVADETDLIITTGGTGLGPRDFTPDVTGKLLEKNLTGFMEHIRLKYGAKKTAALLSRGVAGTIKRSFIMNMPGSVRAVTEYTNELLPIWDHIKRMIHSIDHH